MEKFVLPTGTLFIDEYSRGQLETLSIGDYGKSRNIKADFLGYYDKINGVANGKCMPLQEKWVITLSTQYGCMLACLFCNCPNIKFNGNASFDDLKKQLYTALSLYPNVKYTDRLNIHFARMGEPSFNTNVLDFAKWLAYSKKEIQNDTGIRIETIHPVFTTALPKSLKQLEERILSWCNIKNLDFRGQAGLQFSINSTDNEQRDYLFSGKSLSLEDIAKIAEKLPEPLSRKYCLNFALASDNIVDAKVLSSLFDKTKFMVKITPIHNCEACIDNNIETIGGYSSYHPYEKVENDLLNEGWDVLVFIPSMDEENGTITCGNAILGGSKIKL